MGKTILENGKIYLDGAYLEKLNVGGNDSYTKLLLHMDGANGSTTFTDSSSGAKTVTANGNVQINTLNKKFGTGAAYFDGSGDYLSIADSADWNLSNGDFTIDYWMNINNNALEQIAFSQVVDVNNRVIFYYNGTGGTKYIQFYAVSGGSVLANYSLNWTPVNGSWYHIEIVRNGSTLTLYINGVAQTWTSTGTAIGTNTLPDLAAPLEIGRQNLNTAYSYWNGYIDEFRWSKGIARHTSGFNVQNNAYGSGVLNFVDNSFYQEAANTTSQIIGLGTGYLTASNIGGNDTYTKLLCHFDGRHGTSVFTDSSSGNKTLTPVGSPTLTEDYKKFGISGVDLVSGAKYFTLANSSDWTIGTNNFTIEGWITIGTSIATSGVDVRRMFSAGGYGGSTSNLFTAGYGHNDYWGAGTKLFFDYWDGSNWSFGYVSSTVTLTVGNTYHVVFERYNNSLTGYVNGVSAGSTACTTNFQPSNLGAFIGARRAHDSTSNMEQMKDYLDEFRFSNGTARFQAAFTPPTQAYGMLVPKIVDENNNAREIRLI